MSLAGPDPAQALARAQGPGARLEALFADQAARTPDAVAVVHRGRTVTYRDLERRANRIAWRLTELGVGPGVLAGICMARSPDLIAAMLAVLKTGGAYLPLDPDYPRERLEYMLADSSARLLVTDAGPPAGLAFGGRVLSLSEQSGAIAAHPEEAPPAAGGPHGPTPDDLAYVIYTSGSTGRPKGVMLAHTAVALIGWAGAAFTPAELARVAATTSVSFDPSVFEIYAPICTGGTVVLKEHALDPFAADEQPTLLNCVPSVLAELCRMGAVPESVRVINVGGEPLKAALVREVYRRTRAQAVYNHYGPTEATTCTTVALVPADVEQDPPIGRPIAGAELHLLDKHRKPVAAGAVGELYIGGPALALGYLGRPDLTASRFVQAPPEAGGGRLYRTGDLCRWSKAGELQFVGRADEQVKLNGVRIELGEIEHVLLGLPGVRDAAAVIREDETGRRRLVAYVVSDETITLGQARERLRGWLPEHMTPSALVTLPAFPLTLSGKVDRTALPAPPRADAAPGAREDYASHIEEAVADVFKDVLRRTRFGPEESFFEQGGDSLLGVQAALRLEEMLGYSVPSALIHQAPTPRSLAEALRLCPMRQPRRMCVLQDAGAGAPLFCISDLFGRPFSYLSLARRLAPDRPVYGLSPGPLEEAFVTAPSIADLTSAYLADLRAVQPRGPYFLAGYSAAGVVAFDLARRLAEEGEPSALILLDCPALGGARPILAVADWVRRQVVDLMDPRRAATRLRRMYELRHKALETLTPLRNKRAPGWVPGEMQAFANSLIQAWATYRYGTFEGPVLFVKCMERDRLDQLKDHDGLLGWGRALTGPVRTIEVDSNHHAFMREPGVAKVAAHMAEFIDGALVTAPQARPRARPAPEVTPTAFAAGSAGLG